MTSKVAALCALLMNAAELSAAQARDLPASWALFLSNLELADSAAQLGEGSGNAGLRVKKKCGAIVVRP